MASIQNVCRKEREYVIYTASERASAAEFDQTYGTERGYDYEGAVHGAIDALVKCAMKQGARMKTRRP